MKVKQYETYFREKFDKERFYAGHATNYGPINRKMRYGKYHKSGHFSCRIYDQNQY